MHLADWLDCLEVLLTEEMRGVEDSLETARGKAERVLMPPDERRRLENREAHKALGGFSLT